MEQREAQRQSLAPALWPAQEHRGSRAVGPWVCTGAVQSGQGSGAEQPCLGAALSLSAVPSPAQPRAAGPGRSSSSPVFGSSNLSVSLEPGSVCPRGSHPWLHFSAFLPPHKVVEEFLPKVSPGFSRLPDLPSSSRVTPGRVTRFVLSAASVVTGAASPNRKSGKSMTPHL